MMEESIARSKCPLAAFCIGVQFILYTRMGIFFSFKKLFKFKLVYI